MRSLLISSVIILFALLMIVLRIRSSAGSENMNGASNEYNSSAVIVQKSYVNTIDDMEMMWVEEGEFIMGNNVLINTKPQRQVYLDSYWISKYEVSVAQYRKFCHATAHEMPKTPGWGWIDTHPIVNVAWEDAVAYAKWAGASLPSEAQWEKAARGLDGRKYPWGNNRDNNKCNCSRIDKGDAKSTAPIGSYPADVSPYGCFDMSGNAKEWCNDRYDANYYATAPNKNPTGPDRSQFYDAERVSHGGSWYYFGPTVTYSRGGCDFAKSKDTIGFRYVILNRRNSPEMPAGDPKP